MPDNMSILHLEVDFDIDQLGDRLVWRYARSDARGNPLVARYAGTIYLTRLEALDLRIRAGGVRPIKSFDVLDCCVVTRPEILRCIEGEPVEFALPSPFVYAAGSAVAGATINLDAARFKPAKTAQEKNYHLSAQKWDGVLMTGDAVGRWNMSLVITVRINHADGTASVRVFECDQEAVVGATPLPA
jgi:hypothetical protein